MSVGVRLLLGIRETERMVSPPVSLHYAVSFSV
jgi:hypothetical protein